MKTTDLKQRTAYTTALIAFVIGWGLTIWGFIVPPKGEISPSVLTALGEAMVYAASVFGVTLYFNHRLAQLDVRTRQYLRDREQAKENADEAAQEEE